MAATRRVVLTPSVVSAMKIRTAPIAREFLGGGVELPGEVASDPDRTARIASPVAGRIETVFLSLGALVHSGDRLLTVRVPELSRLRADAAAKEAMSRVAKANAERTASLGGVGASSQKEVAQASGEAAAMDVQARAAAEIVRELGTSPGVEVTNSVLTLRAPVAGTVISRNATMGQPVLAEQVLGTIADLRQVWFVARVYEGDLNHVHVGDRAAVRFNAYPDRHFDGQVSHLGEQVDPVTRAVTARIVLDNSEGLLRLGLFGTMHVTAVASSPKRAPLVVPEGAVTDIGGKPTAFVQVGEASYELRVVVLGASAVGKVEIVSGLGDGDEIVVDGAFTLKSVTLRGTLGNED